MTIEQISVFLENKPGSFSNVAAVLSKNGINMRAMSVAETSDFGILRMIVDDPEKTKEVLSDE
ncbi:MAG: ACT domain-containing protein, partial [Clostridia bacterium]